MQGRSLAGRVNAGQGAATERGDELPVHGRSLGTGIAA